MIAEKVERLQVRRSKRLRIVLWLGILILGVGIGGWLTQPKPILKALNTLPPGYFLVDASEIERKPLFDFRLPIIGRLTYPMPFEAPEGFDPKVSAGFIAFRGLKTDVGPVLASWEVNGERFVFEAIDKRVVECPRVYGEVPVTAILRLGGHPPLRVKLPSTGTRAPRARVQKIALEDAELICKPKPWLSPQFPIRYALTYRGKSMRLLTTRRKDPKAGFAFRTLPVGPGLEGQYLDIDPKAIRDTLLVVNTVPSSVHKFRVNLGPIPKSPAPTWTSPVNLTLKALDGSFSCKGLVVQHGSQLLIQASSVSDSKVMARDNVLQVGSTFLGAAARSLSVGKSPELELTPMPNWKNGQIVEARVFTTINGYESWEIDFPPQLGELD